MWITYTSTLFFLVVSEGIMFSGVSPISALRFLRRAELRVLLYLLSIILRVFTHSYVFSFFHSVFDYISVTWEEFRVISISLHAFTRYDMFPPAFIFRAWCYFCFPVLRRAFRFIVSERRKHSLPISASLVAYPLWVLLRSFRDEKNPIQPQSRS